MNNFKIFSKKIISRKLYIIVEARSTSKRLKNKHLYKFQRLSLIRILIKKLKKLKNINGIILSTTTNKEDDKLVLEAKKEGILIFRGSELNVLDRVLKTCTKFKLKEFCRVTGDCPLIDIKYLQLLINNYLLNYSLDFISNSVNMPTGQGGSIVKVNAIKKALKYSKKNKKFREFITLYIIKNKQKFKTMFLYHGEKIKNQTKSFGLDTKKDIDFIKKVSKKFNLLDLTLDQLIKFKY